MLIFFLFFEVDVGGQGGVKDLSPNNLIFIANLEHLDIFAHPVDRSDDVV